MPMEDIERFTQNKELCAELWEKCEPTLRSLCKYKLASCPDEVEDVIASAFLVLCQAVADEKEFTNPKAWLLGVTNILIKKKYEEISKSREILTNFSDDEYNVHYNVDVFDEIISDTALEVIRLEIEDELTDDERKLLDIVYGDHEKKMKYKEVAKIFNTTESAIKQRVFRLNRKIRFMAKNKIENYL